MDVQAVVSSAMDDMAWGAVWMYSALTVYATTVCARRATKDTHFLFEAQELLERHYQVGKSTRALDLNPALHDKGHCKVYSTAYGKEKKKKNYAESVSTPHID
eukprot:1161740-Pelagomonas_calceolata.AAC.4